MSQTAHTYVATNKMALELVPDVKALKLSFSKHACFTNVSVKKASNIHHNIKTHWKHNFKSITISTLTSLCSFKVTMKAYFY